MTSGSEDYKLDPTEAVAPGPVSHPGGWVRRNVLEPNKLSVSRTAELLGVDRSGFSQVLSGRYALSADLAYRLEALTGVDADLLIAMQAAHERDRDRPLRETYKKAITRLEPLEEAPDGRRSTR